jgi:D-alanyl-D-alanine carboxypeptidase (penicillin-binding protein 5/6)
MTNHNHLLGTIPGVDGLKTGFTSGAGFCLSAAAERGGRRIIVVMMDSPDSRTRDLNVQELISLAFASLPLGGPAFEAAPDPFAAPKSATFAPSAAPTPAGGPVIRFPGAATR